MIPNIHQSIDEIIRAAGPAEKICWQQIRLITGENAAIRQIYYVGTNVGTEYITASPNKLYLALELDVFSTLNQDWNNPYIRLVNGAGGSLGDLRNLSMYYNGTTASVQYIGNNMIFKNLMFSSLLFSVYTHFKIIGYKITY